MLKPFLMDFQKVLTSEISPYIIHPQNSKIGGDKYMENKHYKISNEVCISRNGLIEILRKALIRGDCLFWIASFTVKDGCIILKTVDNLMGRLTIEDLLLSLRELTTDILSKAVVDGELETGSLLADDVDLLIQVGFFGTLVYD